MPDQPSAFLSQLLKGVTIASGGVLPRIHPELLAKKRGTKGKSETILSPPPEKRGRKAASGKKGGKKSKATKPRTSKKVSGGVSQEPGIPIVGMLLLSGNLNPKGCD